MNALKFVIVGHIDHGKSTLIGRLLYDTNSLPLDKIEEIKSASKDLRRKTEFAYLLDHLEEERRQGITIDTTQVFFKTDKRDYVIIDAPGHVEFVKNMITGASQAEAALLIVDANEGIREQTKRHATILSLLGIEQIVVIVNKMDLVNFNQEIYQNLKNNIESFLKTINLTTVAYIPISALLGDNVVWTSKSMPWYGGPTILGYLDLFKNRESLKNKPLILPIQDIYKIDDKRIAVGRIESGRLKKGQEVKIFPEGKVTKVKSIEKFCEEPQVCSAGESIGFITDDAVFLERGNVICQAGSEPKIKDTFQASIFWMAKQGYLKGEKIFLRCATQDISCKIEQIYKRINSSNLEIIGENAQKLENLEIGKVSIKTKRPIVIETFKEVQELGRFVLCQDGNILAGGIITKI